MLEKKAANETIAPENVPKIIDQIKSFGFKYATLGATSVNILDMRVPKEKEEELKCGDSKANEVYKYFFK